MMVNKIFDPVLTGWLILIAFLGLSVFVLFTGWAFMELWNWIRKWFRDKRSPAGGTSGGSQGVNSVVSVDTGSECIGSSDQCGSEWSEFYPGRLVITNLSDGSIDKDIEIQERYRIVDIEEYQCCGSRMEIVGSREVLWNIHTTLCCRKCKRVRTIKRLNKLVEEGINGTKSNQGNKI